MKSLLFVPADNERKLAKAVACGADALAWGWNGGWRRWRCQSPSADNETTLEQWTEVGAITGHRAPVRSVAWSPGGEYLISAR